MKNLYVLLLGNGKMGNVEGVALRAIRPELLKEGYNLHLSVVEKMPDRREAARTYAQNVFETCGQAVQSLRTQNAMPEILVMALNDKEHFPAFNNLLATVPSIKAVFSEKPLTATQDEADALSPLLKDKFVSLNTIINFSPVFDRFNKWKLGRNLTLTKIECFWHKDRTKDTRPTIGIATDIVHPLGVASEMLHQGGMSLVEGVGYRGLLSEKAPDVLYEIDTNWITEKGIPLYLFSSYGAHTQRRSVIAHYSSAQGEDFKAAFDFDCLPKTDRLTIIRRGPRYDLTELDYTTRPEDINTCYEGMTPDRVSAFIGQSMRAYLHPESSETRVSNLQSALLLQTMVEQVNVANPKLRIASKPATQLLAERAVP